MIARGMMNDLKELFAGEIVHLRRFAFLLVGNDVRADDLVQDTLEKAWRKRKSWRGTGTLRSWMFRILYRTHINSLRNERQSVEFDERWHTTLSGDHPESQEMGIELDDFARALEVLPREQRTAVVLVGLKDFSYDAAAETLGVPVGTLRSRLFRGRENLSRMMEEGGDELQPRLRRTK